MSIPLVQNNEKDSINTSIIAIKRNIERINMLLGLVDSGSPDLSGLATKQELEDAITQVETDLAPVDEVTVGNMYSVTSNAVARALETGNNANGSYVKLATGLLLQWGIIRGVVFNSNTPQQQVITYTLPISFVDNNYSIICNLLDPIRGTNSGTPNLASPKINTKNTFVVMYTKNYTLSWDTTGTDLYWQAVGFWK